jgi:hypothetical protein
MAQALFVAALFMLVFVLYCARVLAFLAPYKWWLLHEYGTAIAVYATALYINLTALLHWLSMLLPLRHTGRKLTHIDQQLQTQRTVFDECVNVDEEL